MCQYINVSDIFIVGCKAHFFTTERQTHVLLFLYLFHVKCQPLLSVEGVEKAVEDFILTVRCIFPISVFDMLWFFLHE